MHCCSAFYQSFTTRPPAPCKWSRGTRMFRGEWITWVKRSWTLKKSKNGRKGRNTREKKFVSSLLFYYLLYIWGKIKLEYKYFVWRWLTSARFVQHTAFKKHFYAGMTRMGRWWLGHHIKAWVLPYSANRQQCNTPEGLSFVKSFPDILTASHNGFQRDHF